MVTTTSSRRFDLGSGTQPIVQLTLATAPLFVLLLWFVWNAQYQLQTTSCYDEIDYYDEEAVQNYNNLCSEFIPIEQFVYVIVAICFCFDLLYMYLHFFVPQRHSLINKYITEGETVIGTVYYKPNKSNFTLTSHGYAVYEYESKRIRRRVRIFERYTRERAAILCLPSLPLSGQPKVDLEIDRDTIDLNKPRMTMLVRFVRVWSIFCHITPIFIIINLANGTISDNHLFMLYAIMTFIVIPTVTFIWMYIAWIIYKRWMTLDHTVLDDDEPDYIAARGSIACCFDDQDCESIQMTDYVQMPAPEVKIEKKAKIGFT